LIAMPHDCIAAIGGIQTKAMLVFEKSSNVVYSPLLISIMSVATPDMNLGTSPTVPVSIHAITVLGLEQALFSRIGPDLIPVGPVARPNRKLGSPTSCSLVSLQTLAFEFQRRDQVVHIRRLYVTIPLQPHTPSPIRIGATKVNLFSCYIYSRTEPVAPMMLCRAVVTTLCHTR
jgi:hypothetical protein